MNAGEIRHAELRMRAELVIRDDRRLDGRDASHLAVGPTVAALSMYNLGRHIKSVTASTWIGRAHPIF